MDIELEKDIETLKADLGKFRDSLGATLTDVGTYSREKVNQTRERLSAAMNDFGERTRWRYRRVNTAIQHGCGKAVRTSREAAAKKPFTTMAVSFGMGALTGALLKRKNHG